MPKNEAQIIHDLNDTVKNYPTDICLHSIIENQVRENPDRTALTYQERHLSYQELNRKANRIALRLMDMGVVPYSVVGLCVERSFEMVIGLLAILKAGGAYLPLDPDMPKKRLEFMVQDAGLQQILTVGKFQSLINTDTAEILLLDSDTATSEQENIENPGSGVRPDNLAYVIYTSGSTGQPKGVMIEHRAIVNRLFWMQDEFQLTDQDRILQKTPYSFDVSVWEFFWPLMTGARLVIARPEGHKDNEYLLDTIEKNKVTVIHFVPSMLRMFLESQNLKRARSLRAVICSGEALPLDLEQQFFKKLPSTPLFNLYGPTEAAVDVSCWKCIQNSGLSSVPIGKPIANIQLYILNDQMELVSIGEEGELHIGGIGLARGYLNRKELTAEKFIPNPLDDLKEARLYKTGDLCRYLPDGNIEYLGRTDFQVKIRGFRIELGEIESVIKDLPDIKDCVVIAREDIPGNTRLVAYLISSGGSLSSLELQQKLQKSLPNYMVPSVFVQMDTFPLSPNGKLDRKALPAPDRKRPDLRQTYIAPGTDSEKMLVKVWCRILSLDRIGIDDNFFDLGGNSLLAIQVTIQLQNDFGIHVPVVKLFEFPSISRLAAYLDDRDSRPTYIDEINERATRQRIGRFHDDPAQDGVAIIGMAGKFPGANDIDTLWKNLCGEVESITRFDREELGPGIEDALKYDPDYIPARGIIEDADKFDAAFFGIGPQEAKVMDPQQRIFLELAWAALENAGYCTDQYHGLIGVYAGVGDNHYYPVNLLGHKNLLKMVGKLITGYGNEKDYIATRVSYALNLTGPSVSANTGCSTSLLAVDNAVRALINFECDMALAGGVDIGIPQKSGFLYQTGGVFSKDGHCRPFDSEATGTLFNDGAGIVVLKRVSDARRAGDKIWAIIRGSAKNNDGANKVSFLAPSVDGQAQVIAMAQAQANVLPEDISYIEAHGTGTPMGDPIEIEALSRVFRYFTQKKQFCYIGSLKGNIGHPTIASGVAGLIKATLSLYHEAIPATLHYKKPNPKIDFQNSPFKVVNKLTPWPRGNRPRLAGVSSFGFGGTNVHAIVEEAPVPAASGPSRSQQLLLFSAKTSQALDEMTMNFKSHLLENPDISLPDAAFTLKLGRQSFKHRRFIVSGSVETAVRQIETLNPGCSGSHCCEIRNPDIVFMFPGQGSQYVYMGKNLYDTEPLFRETVDKCCEILQPVLGCDLRDIIYPEDENEETSYDALKNTLYTQPAIFTIEYALALLWKSWGIHPKSMIGHSIGEFVCACLAGVMSLEDALKLVALRGRLMQDLPGGSMLSVRLSSDEIEKRLPDTIQLAAANSPTLCVVSGPTEEVEQLQKSLKKEKIPCKHLHTSHAFHSAMMDPIVEPFIEEVKKCKLSVPQIPFVSTVTTNWITDEQATDPAYWGSHLRMPVKFSHGIRVLIEQGSGLLLEVGPRTTLATLSRQHMTGDKRLPVFASLRDTHEKDSEWIAVLAAMGNLWLQGVTPDWNGFYKQEHRHRIPLPTYPFEKKRYWVDPVLPSTDSVPDEEDFQTDEEEAAQPTVVETADNDELMRRLTAILEQTSGISLDKVPVEATFIEMGMDSLLLSQVAFQIKNEFKVKVTFGQLIQSYPNRKILVDHIRQTSPVRILKPSEADTVPETSKDREVLESEDKKTVTHIPTTDAQQEIWLSCQMGGEASCAYNESLTIRLNGVLQPEIMQQALNQVAGRHEALHATLSRDGKSLILNPGLKPEFSVHDFRKKKKDQELRLQKMHKTDSKTPFDLEQGPLLRVHLIRKAEEKWILLLTAHHIICDGWSLDVLLRDLAAFYSALKSDTPLKLAAPPQISEYTRAFTEFSKTKAYQETESYWLDKYRTLPDSLNLPLDHPRPPVRTYRGARVDLSVAPEIYRKVTELSARLHCSVFNILISAFYIYLHRLSGQNDIVIGIPAADQPVHDQKDLVGHCVNLLPMRIQMEPDQTVESLIHHVQSELLTGYDYLYAYGSLLRRLIFNRDPARMPLLSVGFTSSSEYKENDLRFSGLDFTYQLNPRSFETFEWYMNTREANGKLFLQCHYNTDLFAPETMRFRLWEYETLLHELAENLENPIDMIPVLPPIEKEILQHRWNKTETEYNKELCLHQLFEQQTKKHHGRTALITESEKLSYSELNDRANQLARYLIDLGVGPGKFVGILLQRSVHTLVALLGVLKTGAAYLPLDPTFPANRLQYMLEDSGAPFLIMMDSTADILAEAHQTRINIESAWPEITKHGKENLSGKDLLSPTSSDDIAYIIYTSGSTGKPKGVKIRHRSVVNFILSMAEKPGIVKEDCVLSLTTISFDISVLEIFLPLSTGARLAIIPDGETNDGHQLLRAIRKYKVSLMQATPTTWKLLLKAGWDKSSRLKVLCGGEAMPPDLMPQLFSRATSVWNMYGPTETTIWSTCHEFRDPHETILIGKPIANTTIYILDQNMNSVPVGVWGEMYIGGDGLSAGYHNLPKLTDERFLPHPFESSEKKSVYRTGDLCRFRHDGSIEYSTRLDTQVKIRGYRIELGEIESVLRAHPHISDVAVAVKGETQETQRLIAYLVLKDNQMPTNESLRTFMSQSLPAYIIPSQYIQLEQLPLTPNGKVDRKALPEPGSHRPDLEKKFVAPATANERLLADIWKKLFNMDQIGIHDNFFDLGGHSMLAAQLFAEMEQKLGKPFPLALLFQAPTIAGLARRIDPDHHETDWSCLVPIQTEGHKRPLFLIHPAQGNLLLYRTLIRYFDEDQPVYGIQSQGLDGRTEFDPTFEVVAEVYLKEILKIQPEGPFILGGYCLGGSIALEIARRMLDMNHEVGLLFMIENYNIQTIQWPMPLPRKILNDGLNVWYHLGNLFSSYNTRKWQFFATKAETEIDRMKVNFSIYKSDLQKKLGLGKNIRYHHIHIDDAYDEALIRHQPEPYQGKILLFTAKKRLIGFPDDYYGWKDIALGGIELCELPIYPRGSLTEPYVQELAKYLNGYMNEVNSKYSSGQRK